MKRHLLKNLKLWIHLSYICDILIDFFKIVSDLCTSRIYISLNPFLWILYDLLNLFLYLLLLLLSIIPIRPFLINLKVNWLLNLLYKLICSRFFLQEIYALLRGDIYCRLNFLYCPSFFLSGFHYRSYYIGSYWLRNWIFLFIVKIFV